jgi:hypothetical protein
MRSARCAAALALCALGAAQAPAADFDGTRPFICSVIDANDCALGIACVHELAEDVNLPQFIKVDFDGKTIGARGRTTPIQSSMRANGMLFIQGVQGKRAYSITVTEDTGSFVGTVAGDGEAFAVFGSCTLP